jgi:hypothetical protein
MVQLESTADLVPYPLPLAAKFPFSSELLHYI